MTWLRHYGPIFLSCPFAAQLTCLHICFLAIFLGMVIIGSAKCSIVKSIGLMHTFLFIGMITISSADHSVVDMIVLMHSFLFLVSIIISSARCSIAEAVDLMHSFLSKACQWQSRSAFAAEVPCSIVL